MNSQLQKAISNLEEVITFAGYACEGIVRLNLYTTSMKELWPHFHVLQEWISHHNIKTALTAMEVTVLFETLKVELEATVVKQDTFPPSLLNRSLWKIKERGIR